MLLEWTDADFDVQLGFETVILPALTSFSMNKIVKPVFFPFFGTPIVAFGVLENGWIVTRRFLKQMMHRQRHATAMTAMSELANITYCVIDDLLVVSCISISSETAKPSFEKVLTIDGLKTRRLLEIGY